MSIDIIASLDGTSLTLALVEVKEPFCWMDPTADITLDELAKGINVGRVGSFHPGGCNVSFFDGGCRYISNEMKTDVLRALGALNSGVRLNPRDLFDSRGDQGNREDHAPFIESRPLATDGHEGHDH